MKAVITIILLALTCILYSCSNELHYLENGTEQTESTPVDADGWVPIEQKYHQTYSDNVDYTDMFFDETKDMVIFADTRGAMYNCYLNKANGAVRVLCSDPVCKHSGDDFTSITCAGYCDGRTVTALCYSPEDGRVYYAVTMVEHRITARVQYSVIVSVNADKMDLSVKEHYRLADNSMITSMKYHDGKLYFTEPYVNEDEETRVGLVSLDTKTNKKEVLLPDIDYETRFSVRNGKLYYYTADYILYEYSLDKKTTRVIVDRDFGYSKYAVTDDAVIAQTKNSIVSVDLTTLEKTVLYTSETKADSGHSHPVMDKNGDLYFYGYTPTKISDKQINGSGGKLFRLKDGKAELVYDFGEKAELTALTIIDDHIFVNIDMWIDTSRTKGEYRLLYINGDAVTCIELATPD